MEVPRLFMEGVGTSWPEQQVAVFLTAIFEYDVPLATNGALDR
jgi:hypothetical protein